MFELERNLEQIRNEGQQLTRLVEQSLATTQNLLQSPSSLTDVMSLEREMWQLEREWRLFLLARSPVSPLSHSVTQSFCPQTQDTRDEILPKREELVELKIQTQQITSP